MTITYQEISRAAVKRGGIDIAVEFTDSETGKKYTKVCWFSRANPPSEKVTERFDHNAARIEFRVNPLNDLDIEGIDVRDLLTKLVQYIRNNPTVTFAQLTAVTDAQFPDLAWKPEKILLYLHNYLQNRLKVTFTWDQFKAYVINHKFSGVDG